MPTKTLKLEGERYVCVVVQVVSKDQLGRPKGLMVIHEEETVHLTGGEEFLTVFAKADCVTPHITAKS